ncbi:MAG: PAS domain S-box protein [Candidatus Omnitrophota bacterium]
MVEFFKSQIDYIFFIYGMSFFILAGSAFLLFKIKKQAIPWIWLSSFAIMHAVNEWLDLAGISLGDTPEFKLVRIVILTISFIFLTNFFLASLKHRYINSWLLVPLLAVVYLGWSYAKIDGFNFMARYVLGFIGGLGSGLVLIFRAKKLLNSQRIYLWLSGICLCFYSLTQLVVAQPLGVLADTLFNQNLFFNYFGLPVQLLRCIFGSFLAFLLLGLWYHSVKEVGNKQFAHWHKHKIVFVAGVYFILIVVGWVITQEIFLQQSRIAKVDLLTKVNTAAGPINYKRIETLTGTSADTTSPDFIRLKEEIEAFDRANHDVKYVYLMRVDKEKIIFLVDSTKPDAEDYAQPGQVYTDALVELQDKFFSKDSFVVGPYIDIWGTWLSAFAPIFDPGTGKVIARIGLDIDFFAWQQRMFYLRLLGILASFVLFVFFISIFIINRINSESKNEILNSQKELETIFNSANFWIFYKDKDNRLLRVNDALARVIGIPAKDLVGKSLFEIFPDKKLVERYLQDDLEIIASGKPKLNILEPMDTKAGRFWVQVDKFPFVDTQGNIIGVVGFALDVTERRKLEKAIWDSEDRFRTLVSNVPGAIYRCKNDLGWSMEFISYAIRDISGYPASDFINNKVRTYESIIYEADRQMVRDVVESSILKSQPYSVEYRIIHSDGSLRWVSERGQAVFGEGRLLWLDGAIFDYTEHKKIMQDLQYASEEWQRTFDSMSDLVFILDKDFTITKANKTCFEVLKLKSEQMIGRKCYEVVHGKNNAWANCPFEQTCMDQQIHTEEVNDPRLGGITLLVTTSPILNENKEFIGAIHIAKDITEIKKYQHELEKKNKDLQKLDKLKSEFVSVVSHELRTPLSIIKEGVSLVIDRIPGEINLKQERILSTSKDNINRLARIIDNLLDISKIESGKVHLNKQLTDINGLVHKVVDNFILKAKDKGIQVRLNLPPGELNILVDEDRIFEVFTNLINNSLKFTEKGYVQIEIIDQGDKVQCQVSDTGIGIHKDNLNKLFAKFVQFDRVDGGGEKGTGLGLSIAKGFIELHGGKIWAESVYGEGTQIYFTLSKTI